MKQCPLIGGLQPEQPADAKAERGQLEGFQMVLDLEHLLLSLQALHLSHDGPSPAVSLCLTGQRRAAWRKECGRASRHGAISRQQHELIKKKEIIL